MLWAASLTLCRANSILIPMDGKQRNHLKAYGVAFFMLKKEQHVDWLLNYRDGSFLLPYSTIAHNECTIRGISFDILSDIKVNSILLEIASPAVNMNVVRLETAPRIAVYSPKSEFVTDETDAVILVLDYAEIPYTILYDEEIEANTLSSFDWLHLHHEDFTGQPARSFRREADVMQMKIQALTATRLGYTSVPVMKLAVAKKIKAFCAAGGYLFAMCSGAETFDIALASESTFIEEYEETDESTHALDYSKTLAFENFILEPAYTRKFSNINSGRDYFETANGYFRLFSFSAKWDIIPTMLNQNHEQVIREFNGLTTAFNATLVKPEALVLGENKQAQRVRYIYGELGRGHWTYYGGHDPESASGRGRGAIDLNQYPNSPGYRLILNNVLFPSAKKKKQKT